MPLTRLEVLATARIVAALMIASSALIACTRGSPADITMKSEQQLQSEATLDLCSAYGVNAQAKVRKELMRRNAIVLPEWTQIDAQEVGIGMSTCGVLASWGPPTTIHRTITGTRERMQFIYGSNCRRCGGADYLVIENDRVTSIRT
jgi:hypothetical protein